MRVNERMKKVFSILLCLCMVLQYVPTTAFAVDTAEDGLCAHHTEHNAECHYAEAVEGAPCTHEHSEDCYAILACLHTCGDECEDPCTHECTVESDCITMELDCHHTHGDCGYSEGTAEVPCGHSHNESCGYVEAVAGNPCANAETDPECDHSGDCGYVAAVEGQPCGHTEHTDCGYAPATEGTPCTHTHAVKVDSADSCYKLLCSHKDGGHDDACGYVAAAPAHECHYECAECANKELSLRTSPQTGVAIPQGDAESEEIATSAPDGDLLAMTEETCDCGTDDALIHATTCAVYVAPEMAVCYCEIKCTEANIWCDVCGFDYTACTGSGSAVGYSGETSLRIVFDKSGGSANVETGEEHYTINFDGDASSMIVWKLEQAIAEVLGITEALRLKYGETVLLNEELLGTYFAFTNDEEAYDLSYQKVYSIIIVASENGSVSHNFIDYVEAAEGDTVIVTATPREGYLVDTVAYNGTTITPVEGVYSFPMPAMDITISATFVACSHETYEAGICTACGTDCPHTGYEDGKCTLCGTDCPHAGYEDGTCTACGVQAQAKIGDTYYATLASAAAEAEENAVIVLLTDVTTNEDIAFANFVTLDAGEHTVTVSGAVTIGSQAGIIFENTLYYYGGTADATWEIDEINVPTYWIAGEGYAIFRPAVGEETAVLTLNNATLNLRCSSYEKGAVVFDESLTIRFSGSNHLTTVNNSVEDGVFHVMGDTLMEGIGQNAVLNIQGGDNEGYTIYGSIFDGDLTVLSGTVTIRSGDGGNSCCGASVTGTLTVAPGAVLNAAGGESPYGIHWGLNAQAIEAEGTINGLVVVTDESGTGHYQVYGNTVLEHDLNAVIEDVGYSVKIPFTVPAGTSLTVNSGVTLDLSKLTVADIDFSGTVINNGTILLPEGFDIADAPKSGNIQIGDNTYTWDSANNKWICPEGGHIPVADSCTDKGDGTHSYTCGLCGGTDTEDHTYVDGTCACGAVCPHSNFDSTTGNCTDCETSVAIAKIETNSTTTYYLTADDLRTAIEFNSNDQTLTLLADFAIIETFFFRAEGTKNTLDLNGHTLICSGSIMERILLDGCELAITGTGSINIFMGADAPNSKIVVGSGVTLNDTLRSAYGGVLDLTGATIPEAGLSVILWTNGTTYNVSDVLLLPADYYFFVDGKAVSSYSVETEGTVKKHTEHSYTYTDNGDGTHNFTCTVCGGTGTENHYYDESYLYKMRKSGCVDHWNGSQ